MSVVELVSQLCTRDVGGLAVGEVSASLDEVARVQAWLDALKVAHARRLAQLSAETPSVRPAEQLVDGQRCTRRDADAVLRRAETLDGLGLMEAALGDGRITGGHVDALTRATRQLDDAQRAVLHAREVELVQFAAASTPEVFERELQRQVRNLNGDDGVDELARQRRATRLRIWLDHDSGMYQLRGVFDPLTGLAIRNRLDQAMRTLFGEHQPDTCPEDALEKVDHLRGLALERLIAGGVVDRADDLVTVGASYELSLIIDERTLRAGRHQDSVVDADQPGVELPVETVRRIACLADIIPIVVDDDGVPLRLGRTTRLASRAQRRALRAMYPTCAIPDCQVPARYCQPHHVHWWRHGGTTDVDNLLPLCSRHHHSVHEGGWQLSLRADHSFTIHYPDGTSEHVNAPRRRRRSGGQTRQNTPAATAEVTAGPAVSTGDDRPASTVAPPSAARNTCRVGEGPEGET